MPSPPEDRPAEPDDDALRALAEAALAATRGRRALRADDSAPVRRVITVIDAIRDARPS